MKVTCQGCSGTFKVKGDVAPGRAFKFKCPKCGNVNRLMAEEVASQPTGVAPKTQCEECGKTILIPKEGSPLCDQCRASKAVEEARKKSQDLIEDSGVDFPDEIFDTAEKAPPASDKEAAPEQKIETAPAEKPEAVEIEKKEEAPFEEKLPLEEPATPPLEISAPEPEKVEEKKEELEEKPAEETEPEKPLDFDSIRYYVRSKDGLIIGPIKLTTLRDLIIARKVHSDEECRRDEGEWMGVLEFHEIFEIFESRKLQAPEAMVAPGSPEERAKLLESLKVKKQCEGCGMEIYILDDIPHPLCDQCRIEALVTKKKETMGQGEPRYKIRSADGLVLGPLRKITLEDLIAAGNIQGHEEASVDGGPWHPILEIEELAGLFKEDQGVIELTETIDG